MVCKKSLLERQKMSVALIEDCRRMASQMVARETRGHGDTDNAMRRFAARHGVPHSLLWRLRYRPPLDIGAALMSKLVEAYGAECERQRKIIDHEIYVQSKTGPASALLRSAAALAQLDLFQERT